MTGDLIPMTEAAKRAGVSTATLRRRAASGELVVYGSPLNRRERLVRLEDLTKYAEPRPIAQASSTDARDQELVAG